MNGTMDDFAVYGGALTAAQVDAPAKGGAPGAAPNLIAHWDFNDPPAAGGVTLSATRSGNNITITSDPAALPAGWVIQTAASISGPWTQQSETTPATVPIGTENAFLRAARP
jgi:hypothetical protein